MLRKISFSFMFLVMAISSAWAVQNPVDMLNKTIVSTQDKLMKNASKYQKDPYKLLALVDKKIIPVVSPSVLAQLIVGPKKWNDAGQEQIKQIKAKVIKQLGEDATKKTIDKEVDSRVIVVKKQEQKEFIKSATEMLTFMYAKNVASAGKYKLTLFPFDSENTSWKKKNIVIVNGKITNTDNKQSSDFAVKMFKKDDQWHIYDFDVAGVSILRTYQEQFASFKTVAEMITASEKVTHKIKAKYYPKMLNKDYELKNV